MKATSHHSIADEIEFLFQDVIKVNVLTHAKAGIEPIARQGIPAAASGERFFHE